ncbi:uncharacterized protein LOC106088885 [Stomoxys calcitrans]|uniref:uncharacterized protein LOC106088885 n=1 Tax=Stomoxys calcitrans TaxID=35570 RepID=UPI0027E23914|nr:uncharacterized protein LOC106088885 [Stomoxys calcitrans]
MLFAFQTVSLLLMCLMCPITYGRNEGCASTAVSSTMQNFHDRVLKRRIRSVVFPKKAQLLLTPSLGKAILGGRPRGLGYSIEFDMYNILPDTIETWKPTILLKQLENRKKTEEVKPAVEPIKMSSDNSSYMDLATLYPEFYGPDDWNDMGLYQFPFDDDVNAPWAYYHSKIDAGLMDPIWQKQDPHIQSLATNSKLTPSPIQLFYKRPFRGKQDGAVKNESHQQSEENDASEWYHNQNYRERRQIFDQLEAVGKLFKINMKSCIQRAMCEITTQLKPFGMSLMDDLIRIILTVPPTAAANDDYKHRYSNVNCAHRFSVSCPYRVIEFLTKGLKANFK